MRDIDKQPMVELVYECPRCHKRKTRTVHRRQDNRGTEKRPIRVRCAACESYADQWGRWAVETVR